MRKQLVASAAIVGSLCLFGLAGCFGGPHQVIDSGKACISCHSEKDTYEVASPKDAVASGPQVTVETSASTVLVCRATFTAEDGSSYVPERYNQTSVSGGSAQLTLDEGTWAVCTADGDNVSAEKIVQVTADGAATTIQL